MQILVLKKGEGVIALAGLLRVGRIGKDEVEALARVRKAAEGGEGIGLGDASALETGAGDVLFDDLAGCGVLLDKQCGVGAAAQGLQAHGT